MNLDFLSNDWKNDTVLSQSLQARLGLLAWNIYVVSQAKDRDKCQATVFSTQPIVGLACIRGPQRQNTILQLSSAFGTKFMHRIAIYYPLRKHKFLESLGHCIRKL
jgi:hypothetical protein